MSHQVASGEFAHLAGADDENVLSLKRAENLFCKFDGYGGDGHRRRTYGGFSTNAFGDGEGAGEELIELSANRAYGAGCRISLFHLAEDLRLADYHRIQAGSDAEDMPHGIFLSKLVQVRIDVFRLQLKVVMQKTTQVRRAVGGMSDHFYTVTGGEDHALFDPRMGGKAATEFRK